MIPSKQFMTYFVSLACLLCLFCSKKPIDEIMNAENAMSNARQVGAEKWALSTFQSAQKTLKVAMTFVDDKKYKNAVPLLVTATDLANSAIGETKVNKDKENERSAALGAAKKAIQEENTEVVIEPEIEIKQTVNTNNGSKTHIVRKGESLWTIAGYYKTYNNPWKWYKIFNANKNKIHDPNVIFPGQILTIPS